MFNKILVFMILMINIGIISGEKNPNRSVDEATQKAVFDRCHNESDDKSIITVHDSAGHDNIWKAIARCDKQSENECNDAVKKFKFQITEKELVCWYGGCFDVHLDGNGGLCRHSRKMTPLELSVLSGSKQAVKGLLQNEANPNMKRRLDCIGNNFTLLHDVVDAAYGSGADCIPHAQNADYINIIKLLIKHGADIKATDEANIEGVEAAQKHWMTALQYCDYRSERHESKLELCDFLRKCELEQKLEKIERRINAEERKLINRLQKWIGNLSGKV